MIFPLRWHAFAHGIVERALTPYFRPGPGRVDLFTTVSQGRVDQSTSNTPTAPGAK
ncbi:hypothetical protein [Streptomyces sanglieri]|uniref:hypothetical protein n=1 Tax=Streptomyces sanglieri TaxID=193460 RepID=UPI003524E2C5